MQRQWILCLTMTVQCKARLCTLSAEYKKPYRLEVFVRFVLEAARTGSIRIITVGYDNDHSLASSGKEHPVGILQIFLPFGFMNVLPGASLRQTSHTFRSI